MTTSNPFAALVAQQRAAAEAPAPTVAAVAAPPVGDNPFSGLHQPPPFADVPPNDILTVTDSEVVEEVASATDAIEADNTPAPVTEEEAPTVVAAETEDPKPKRRVGRPRKVKPEADSTPSSDSSDLTAAAVAVSLPADKAWVELTSRAAAYKTEQETASARLVALQSRAEENRKNIITVEHRLGELTAMLETLQEQQETIELGTEDAATELKDTEKRLTDANIALSKVSAYILSLTDNQPGLIGEVRVTVLDGTASIDQA